MTKEEAIKSFEEENRTMLENKTAYINELKARGMEFEDRMASYIDESVERNELAISALKGGWIPIEEREPNNYDEALVCTDTEEIFKATYYAWEGFDDDNGNAYSGEIIAWQPLPEPYKRECEDEK